MKPTIWSPGPLGSVDRSIGRANIIQRRGMLLWGGSRSIMSPKKAATQTHAHSHAGQCCIGRCLPYDAIGRGWLVVIVVVVVVVIGVALSGCWAPCAWSPPTAWVWCGGEPWVGPPCASEGHFVDGPRSSPAVTVGDVITYTPHPHPHSPDRTTQRCGGAKLVRGAIRKPSDSLAVGGPSVATTTTTTTTTTHNRFRPRFLATSFDWFCVCFFSHFPLHTQSNYIPPSGGL